jgi:phytoene synthase
MNGFLELEAVAANFEQCRRYARRYARSFYFASHVLPKPKRLASYAIYAFCRYADELADGPQISATEGRRRLEELREQLRRVYTGSRFMDNRLLAFRETVFNYAIPQEYFLDLLRGFEMDLARVRFRRFEDLTTYCYNVASTVGLMMTHVFGVSDTKAFRHAEELGIAMQLTNILRDVGEDYRRGRVYLPEAELAAFNYSEQDLARGTINENFIALMRSNIERARAYYLQADSGIPLLTDDGSRLCVRLMRRIYSGILDQIEANRYDVFTRRAYVPTRRKIIIALTTMAKGLVKNTEARRPNKPLPDHTVIHPKGQIA